MKIPQCRGGPMWPPGYRRYRRGGVSPPDTYDYGDVNGKLFPVLGEGRAGRGAVSPVAVALFGCGCLNWFVIMEADEGELPCP